MLCPFVFQLFLSCPVVPTVILAHRPHLPRLTSPHLPIPGRWVDHWTLGVNCYLERETMTLVGLAFALTEAGKKEMKERKYATSRRGGTYGVHTCFT